MAQGSTDLDISNLGSVPTTDLTRLRFSVRGQGLAVYPPGAVFGPRRLADFEFVWIEDGNVVWHCDGRDVTAPTGTVLLCRPGMRDRFTWDPSRPTRHGYVHFLVTAGLNALPPLDRWPLACQSGTDDVLRPLLNHMLWLLDARPIGWEPLAHSALRHALAAFVRQLHAGAVGSEAPADPLVMRTIDLVQQHWAGGIMAPLGLEALARLVGVSRAHLARCFRRDLGASPVEAQRLLRLDRATTLLARTTLSIGDIAQRTGFPDPFHFSRAFRAVYGASPRELRRRMIAGAVRPTIRLAQVRRISARL